MKTESEGIRQRSHPRKTWWDCAKADMESFGLMMLRIGIIGD